MTSLSLEFIELTDWLWCLRSSIVACFAIRERDGIVMIDANVAGLGGAIVAALAERLGVPDDTVPLRQILLTHGHADHYGSASELARLTGAELLGPAAERDVFAGRRSRLEPQLREHERQIFERVMPQVNVAPAIVLDRELRPGDPLEWEIGAELVAAPGHTPGQLSVWIPTKRTLIAADAIATRGDGLPMPGVFNVDPDEAAQTARRLIEELQPSRLCVAHGEPVTGDIRGLFDASRVVGPAS
jgi:glyoxylase-like metal-dependent hydrolase (beta-lactamase superfamily II)